MAPLAAAVITLADTTEAGADGAGTIGETDAKFGAIGAPGTKGAGAAGLNAPAGGNVEAPGGSAAVPNPACVASGPTTISVPYALIATIE